MDDGVNAGDTNCEIIGGEKKKVSEQKKANKFGKILQFILSVVCLSVFVIRCFEN